jgi:hypothetical protein
MKQSIDFVGVSGVALAIFTAVLAGIALWALYIAKYQLKAQQRASAVSLFSDYLKLCLQYPDLAKPNQDYDGTHTQENFIALTLLAYEEILEVCGNDAAWRQTIKYNLCECAKILQGLDSKDYFSEGWSPELLKIIEDVMEEVKSETHA